MRDKASPFLHFALVASASLHAALLGGAALRDPQAKRDPELDLADRWSARSVEVGTVPDEARPTPANAPPTPSPTPKQTESKPVLAAPRKLERSPRSQPQAADDANATQPRRLEPAASASISRRGSSTNSVASAPLADCAPGCAKEKLSEPSSDARNADADPAGGDLGETELPRGVRHFATAFVRAVPAASYSDPAWSELPLGAVGEIVVQIHMNAEGRIEDVAMEPETPSPILRRMTDRAILLLKSGVFSLDRKSVGAGVERLALAVTLTEGASDPDEAVNPRHLRALAYEAPTRLRAGYARFTLNSGREMRAVVRRVDP